MNKSQLLQMWDHLRQTHGISLRLIQALPADKIDSHPIPKMRTPKELVIHLYATVREMAEGVNRGEVKNYESAEKATAEKIKTHADLLAFVNENWKAADQVVRNLTDTQLSSIVKTPWNFEAPGFVMIGVVHDEFLHHRGQLYAFARALGAEPPMMWDFAGNAAEYQPKQTAQA